jgi:hypothetical protein
MSKAPLIVFFLAAALTLEAQEKIGETVYLEGEVSITRNGDVLDSSAVVIGVPIDNFDLMGTGDDGNAQVKITTTRAAASTITVSPDTQFTFELSTLQGRQASSISLISGSLSLKVSKLSGSQDLDVQTESTVLGVRGTEFNVSTSDAGDVLVTCKEGAVSCRTEAGVEYRAVPGTIVENQVGGAFRTIPVSVSNLESFRQTWTEQRGAAVRANATNLIQTNAKRYQQLRASYDRDYAALMQQRNVVSRWTAEDRQGRIGSAAEVEQQKRAVASTMLRLRATQFQLERVQARLFRLKRIHDLGFGRGTLPGGTTTTRFFDQLQGERSVVNSHMATVRNVARLYAVRNDGQDPTSRTQMLRQRTVPQGRPQKAPSPLERPAHQPKAAARAERPSKERPLKKKIPGEPNQGTAP